MRTAAWALVAGALITAIGGVAGQVVDATTDVSDDLFRYPWPEDVFVATSILWAVSFALMLPGLVLLRAAGLAGPGRGARTGLALAVAGIALFVVAELASIPVRDQRTDEGGAGLVGALFGLATLLTGAGLTAAGRAAARSAAWPGRPQAALTASGVLMLLMLGLVLTPVMPAAVAIWGALMAALGVALARAPEPAAPPAAQAAAGSSIALP